MADLKHTAAEIDAAIYKVERGSVVTENTESTVTPDGAKPVSGGAVYAALQGLMPATPSGDPMHYAYEAAGATWLSSTGFWSLNTLTDITNEQMRKIYNLGRLDITSMMLGSSTVANVRTNLWRGGRYNLNQASSNILGLAYGNEVIEVINLSTTLANTANQNTAGIVSLSGLNTAFYGCKNLRMIYGRMSIAKVDAYYTQNAFYGCSALEEVRIDSLSSISCVHSPNLSNASILHFIQNSKPTTAITFALHPTAYARAMADSDILSALASNPNITLISA